LIRQRRTFKMLELAGSYAAAEGDEGTGKRGAKIDRWHAESTTSQIGVVIKLVWSMQVPLLPARLTAQLHYSSRH